MSFGKYHGETSDSDGEQLWWPGGPNGFPFRGNNKPPIVKEEEYQNLPITSKFRNKLFYLSDEEDAKMYTYIRDKCANGLFIPIDKERTWDEATKHYKVYLEWVEPAYELPRNAGANDAVKQHINNKTNSTTFPVGQPTSKES